MSIDSNIENLKNLLGQVQTEANNLNHNIEAAKMEVEAAVAETLHSLSVIGHGGFPSPFPPEPEIEPENPADPAYTTGDVDVQDPSTDGEV